MRDNLSISQKGLLLLAIPIVFQAVFLAVLVRLRTDQEHLRLARERAREVLIRTENLFRDLMEAQSDVRGYVITKNEAFLTHKSQAQNEYEGEIRELQLRVADDSSQGERLSKVAERAVELMQFLNELETRVTAGEDDVAATMITAGEGERLRGRLRDSVDEFLDAENKLEEAQSQAYRRTFQQITWLIWIGAFLLFVLVPVLMIFFGRTVAARLQLLEDNISRLGEGRELTTPITGRDEAARLDRAFRQMAFALNQSRKREQDYAISLERRSTALEAANRELQNFASVASHDLQEPLRKIQAFGDRLRDRFSDSLGDQGRDYLERMRAAATRMRTLIDDLLNFSRLQTRAKPFEKVDLTEIAREVVSDLETRIQQSEGRVDLGELPTLEADPTQMRQLLQNLIGNALKFRRPEEPPLVQVSAERLPNAPSEDGAPLPEAPLWRIIVRDTGIGFDEKYLDRIFDVFQRLHGRNEYEGTGMGLAICRRIVIRHGGRITATSTLGKGTTFSVILPEHQPEPEKREADTHDVAEESGRHPHGG